MKKKEMIRLLKLLREQVDDLQLQIVDLIDVLKDSVDELLEVGEE
jgi:hypothetical protein